MKRFLSFLTSFVFLIWILPLGIFIKPSQEKEFCNGQRAICLCSHLVAKAKDKGLTKRFLSQAAPVKEERQASGASHYLLSSLMDLPLRNLSLVKINPQYSAYQFLLARSLDPVPKIIFLI